VVETTTCPSWLSREALAALPDSLVLREVRYRIGTSGFRTREITLITTLLDAETCGVRDLAELYRQRWPVESSQPYYSSREHWYFTAA
jgi:putative transposase